MFYDKNCVRKLLVLTPVAMQGVVLARTIEYKQGGGTLDATTFVPKRVNEYE
jgi:hypothetical protein